MPARLHPVHSASYALADQERMANAKCYLEWLSRLITPELGRRVVEVGCGLGNFTEKLLDRELVVALDIEADCVARLKERFAGRENLYALVSDPESDSFLELARYRPDSCLSVNVLEHIENDHEALARIASILVPGGVVVVFVPAFPALYGGVDRSLGHYRRYRRRALEQLADGTGLRLKKSHYVNIAGFFAWWFNSHVLRSHAFTERKIKAFDRFVAPVSARLEAIAHPPFGQSLFAVFEKPA